MKISKTHQDLSTDLKNPGVLTNPELFFGPNWETVLRWWLYWESLTDKQRNKFFRRWYAVEYYAHIRAWNLAAAAAKKVVSADVIDVVWRVTMTPVITYELIANLDDPFFLPLVVPEFNYKQN